MNANEISPIENPRLSRIKIVSRVAKLFVLGFLIFMILGFFSVCFSNWRSFSFHAANAGTNPDPSFFGYRTVLLINQVVIGVWYWKLARLFSFYERGLIFTAGTICCIKTLGLLCVIGWTLMVLTHFLPQPLPFDQNNQKTWPPGVTLTHVHTYRMGFFNFDFGTGIDFGLLLAGVAIVLIAWIMDEGRKIQEEQELTV
jgi:hypothetical protein